MTPIGPSGPVTRLAFLCTQDGGGPVDATAALAGWFARQGTATSVFGPTPRVPYPEGVRHVEVPVPSKYDVGAMSRAMKAIKTFGAQVIHAQDRRAGLLLSLMAPRLGQDRPVCLQTYHGVPYGCSDAWVYRDAGPGPGPRQSAILAADAMVARILDRTLVVTPGMAEFLTRRLRVPRNRVQHIDNGLDLSREPAAPPSQLRRLAVIGGLIELKGIDVLFHAMSLLDGKAPLTLDIIGDGELRPRLERLKDELHLGDRVRFLGFRRDIDALLDDVDGLVLPSRLEQQPLVVIRALGAARAVVGTDVGGVADMLQPVPDGTRVCPSNSPQAIATALESLSSVPGLKQACTRNRDYALRRFSVEVTGAAHQRLYTSLLPS